jgi:heme oxygenase
MLTKTRRFELREQTAAAHAELDRLVGGFDTIGDYSRYLTGIHAFRAAVEPCFEENPAICWRPEPLRHLIEADMADLGIGRTPAIGVALQPRSISEALGIAYVLEGSRLGAKLLFRRAILLGFGAEHGARHLSVQSQGADCWKNYIAALEAAEPFDPDAAVAAASATFGLALDAFRRAAR